VNSSSREWGSVALSTNKLTLYFASERPGGEGNRDLYQATRASVDDDWGNVTNLGTGVNTSSFEANPYVSEDGTTLYFTSDRAGGEGGFDIWVATRASTIEEFGDVQNPGPAINTPAPDGGATMPAGELSIYFGTQDLADGFGGYDLYTATRPSVTEPFEPAVNLGPGINTDVNEFPGFVTLDESLFLYSDALPDVRPGGEGSTDMWFASLQGDGTFGNVGNLGAVVNTPDLEAWPVLSPDWPSAGSTLYFVSNRPGTTGPLDFWQATWVPANTCGDINGSGGIVDLVDFASFAVCFGQLPSSSTACANSDMNQDGAINLQDFATFSLTFNGNSTNVPPNCP
jgi:hypothetical protein